MKTITGYDWRDVLLKAASIVEEGWCQGVMYRRKDGTSTGSREMADQSCASGAISRAFFNISESTDLVTLGAAQDGLEYHLSGSIEKWNDASGRTATEVAEAMRQAATEERT